MRALYLIITFFIFPIEFEKTETLYVHKRWRITLKKVQTLQKYIDHRSVQGCNLIFLNNNQPLRNFVRAEPGSSTGTLISRQSLTSTCTVWSDHVLFLFFFFLFFLSNTKKTNGTMWNCWRGFIWTLTVIRVSCQCDLKRLPK